MASRLVSLVAVLGLVLPGALVTQELDTRLDSLRMAPDSGRVSAFYAFLRAGGDLPGAYDQTRGLLQPLSRPDREKVAGVLIAILEREVARLRNYEPGNGDQMDFSYLGDVVASVTALKDRRAVPSLVAMIGTGNLATDGLADLGEYAVPMVVETLDSEETIARAGATTTLGKIAQRRSELGLGAGTVATVRAVLMSALEDESFMVRRRAIDGLMSYSGDDIRQAMEELEASDPYQNPLGQWTVRVAAREWLEHHRDVGGTGHREHTKPVHVFVAAAYTQRGHLTRSCSCALS